MCLWNSMASWPAIAPLTFAYRRKRFASWCLDRRRSFAALRVNFSLHQNRVMFCAMDGSNDWIREKAAASLNPSPVEPALVQLSVQWPPTAPLLADVLEQFPLGEVALLHLLAVSSVCATRLSRNPETFMWLRQREVCLGTRGYAEMSGELHALTNGSV